MLTRRDLTGMALVGGSLATTAGAQSARPSGQAFSLNTALSEREKSGKAVFPIMKVPSMRLLIYALGAGEEDKQTPHEDDEIYYVVKGNAKLSVDGKDFAAEPGAILFVPAHAVHKFHSITEPLETFVFFATTPPPEHK